MCSTAAVAAVGGVIALEVAAVGVAILARLNQLEARTVALNDQQTEALTAAVGAIGVDLNELAERLASSDVADDPVVAQAIEALTGYSQRIDGIAAAPDAAPPVPPDPGVPMPPVEPPAPGDPPAPEEAPSS